jgi:hypothetical protein
VIRLRLSRSLAAIAVLAFTAFGSASAVASTCAPNLPSSVGLPAGKVLLIGDIDHPQILDVNALRKLPAQTVEVTFKTGSGDQHHVYVGPLLLDVLTQAGPKFDPAIKNDKLRHFISVSATDGYRVLVAYGEIDPNFENKQVLLATSEDGRALDADGPRLVVPGDIAGGRYVTNVNRVFLEKPPL